MDHLYKNVIKKESLDLLSHIQSNKHFNQFYLAGGTALSLQIGHRESIDLDLFSPKPFKRNIVIDLNLNQFSDYSEVFMNDNSIDLIASRTKVFLWYYAYELTREVLSCEGFRLADPVDIGLAKLLAIQGRNTRKDIIDLFFIDKEIIKLEELLEIFDKERNEESLNKINNYKRLFDYEKLELDVMPKMIVDFDWQECLDLVTSKISKHVRNSL
ncbi:MAG: nucleotidyl transferase AbiEii/AbiGii toxin family protein [Candidatus Dojkabacteria bacterium]|nr:nucleotidyl transferase AbiEii/AbiGii toxin family protein [Candidatus Dojkabacteria bacterium]MDQ7020789.1 nucleotidyl transferase AbiEii/AbiGii toxin family protein [Candidatus Dojkabacteria bacterium]